MAASRRLAPRLARYAGLPGYVAGEAPAGEGEADGRFRIQNVPSRGRICVYERSTMNCLGSTMSSTDGTWRIDGLDPAIPLTVIGWDGTRTHNAAIQDWIMAAVD